MGNSWFRMYAEFAYDPKVQMLSEQDQRRFVMLLCLRCSNVSETFHETEIAFQLRIKIDEWQETRERFLEKKLIGTDNKPLNWDKRQFKSDLSTERVRKHRGKSETVMKRSSNSDVTPPESDTDTDILVDTKVSTRPQKGTNGRHCPHLEIIDAYHKILPELPTVKDWTERRKTLLKNQWKSRPERQDLSWWEGFFRSVREQPFLLGDSDKGWKADLEWLIRPKNLPKVLEQHYGKKKGSGRMSKFFPGREVEE